MLLSSFDITDIAPSNYDLCLIYNGTFFKLCPIGIFNLFAIAIMLGSNKSWLAVGLRFISFIIHMLQTALSSVEYLSSGNYGCQNPVIFNFRLSSLRPSKGFRFVQSSYKIHPRDQMSVLVLNASSLQTSGDKQKSVP